MIFDREHPFLLLPAKIERQGGDMKNRAWYLAGVVPVALASAAYTE